MTLDTKRHDELFDKNAFDIPLHLIGAGGVGSAVARQLSKLGVGSKSEFHLWDGDTVAPHNPPNQAYDMPDVGSAKVDALATHIRCWGDGTKVIPHHQFVKEKISLTGVVLLCLDDMQARKDVCEASLWGNAGVSLVIETRMDASMIIVHTFDPCDTTHTKYWNMYWYPNNKMENEAGCGGHLSIISTVEMCASMAVHQFVTGIQKKQKGLIYNQIQLNLRTLELKKSLWQQKPVAT